MSLNLSPRKVSLSGASSTHRDWEKTQSIEPDLPDKYYVEYQFNELGCRGRDYLIPRPKGGKRLLVLGDSYALGVVVHEADTLAKQLEQILNQERFGIISRTPFEVINCGVHGCVTRAAKIFY